MPSIPTLVRERQSDSYEFEDSLFCIVSVSLPKAIRRDTVFKFSMIKYYLNTVFSTYTKFILGNILV